MKMLLRNAAAPGGLFFEVERFPFLIGRSHLADGPLPLGFISRSHCRFCVREEEVLVEDLDSSNGTYVNGKRVTEPTPIHDGDALYLGPLGLRVTLVRAGAPPKRTDSVGPRRPLSAFTTQTLPIAESVHA